MSEISKIACRKEIFRNGEQQDAIKGERTIRIYKPNGEKEWQSIEEEPEPDFHKPASMLQVAVSLVALIFHANHGQCEEAKEHLQRQ